MKNIWIAILFTTTVYGCYKDKGNYDIIDYNEIKDIRTRDISKYRITLGETIIFDPVITWKYPDRDTTEKSFEFEWRFNNEVISKERILEVTPTSCGNNQYYLYITEKSTAVTYRHLEVINVESPYKTGLLVIAENEGKSTINYFRRDTRINEQSEKEHSWVNFFDIYAKLHPDNPIIEKISGIDSYPIGFDDDEVIIFTENGNSYLLNGLDLEKYIDVRQIFRGNDYPAGFSPTSFIRAGGCDFILGNNGNVHYKRNPDRYFVYNNQAFIDVPVFFPNGAYISKILNVCVAKTHHALFYDKKNNRILAVPSSFDITHSREGNHVDIINTTNPSEFVDINNMTGYELVYFTNYNLTSMYFSILKDINSGKYLTQNFQLTDRSLYLELTDAEQSEFLGNHLVGENAVFCRMRKTPYVYFGDGSNLYFYNINNSQIKLYNNFGAGRITNLMPDADGSSVIVVVDDKEIFICDAQTNEIISSPNPGEKGILHHISGIGEIKSIAWKWGDHTNYNNQIYSFL